MGPGTIQWLRRKAEKAKLDPNVWFNNVELVAAERIGQEPVQYVRNIYKYYVVAREEFGYRWDRGTSWLERVIDFAGKAGLGWGFLQFAIPI